jgi:murein L,D-transpeptidase YafK
VAYSAGKGGKLTPGNRYGARYAHILLAAALTAAASSAPAMGSNPAERPGRLAAGGTASEPDALLFKTLVAITHNRLNEALVETDKVLQAYPNFRLAHLIKGDLLLARTQPLTMIGNAAGAPQDKLADLRDEARVRLARYNYTRPAGQIPRYLLQLEADQKYAFVVDTSRSTLYVFENRDGTPQYIADYYISSGKNGIDKLREGDKKTPVGVYYVTSSKPREKLADFYGSGAYPLNYPNEWDRRQGRDGFGIWLHGTPSDTYSRPPRASDGCVVLTNQDLEAISKRVQVGLTPVIIASDIEWVKPDATGGLRQELTRAVESWRKDWETGSDLYLSHYSPGFSAGTQDFAAWSAQKKQVNASKTWIKVKVDKVGMFLYPGRDNLAVVTFEQDYASSNLSNKMRKRQYWIKEKNSWKIVYEGAA